MNRILIISLALGLFLVALAPAGAEEHRDPLSLERKRTQHFEKFMYSNSAAAPVTVRVKGSFSNAKLSVSLPHLFVVYSRGTVEAFNSRAKDPREYYSSPDVSHEFVWGDFRCRNSNLKLELPWAAGKSYKVASVDNQIVKFELPKKTEVKCARRGLVVKASRSEVEVAHNDGSVSRYSELGSVTAKVGKEVRDGQTLGVAGGDPLSFQLAAPDRNLKYRTLPARFQVSGSAQELTPGSYRR